MTILIVEDEVGISRFMKQGLEEEGYTVLVAYDGKTGYEMALSPTINLILLDWNLPYMSGIDVCRLLRKEKINTPIIFITAKDTIQETIEGLKSGANDYIKKPFDFGEMLERVKVHFRGIKEDKDEIILGENILIVKSKHKVFLSGVEVMLTLREFELLLYMAQRKGEVCRRDEILCNVWGINFEYDTGVIDVFMNAIRKKLKLTKESDLIKTVRGVGFIVN